MSLAGSLKQFHSERADTVNRNIGHVRPSSTGPARTSTPKPAATPTSSGGGEKRSHDTAFKPDESKVVGREMMTQVAAAISYLQGKSPEVITWERITSFLSLPQDLKKNEPNIKRALQTNPRAQYLGKSESGNGKESFKYRPLHPVTNGEELRKYLSTLDTAKGVPVRELKDGWTDCTGTIDRLENEGYILVSRNKKDNAPRIVWADSPSYHVANPVAGSQQVGKVDPDFVDYWCKIKLPANENDIRSELERAGLTPTSAVKEVKKVDNSKKNRKRVEKKNAKKTNVHMTGILKDYSNRKPGAK